VVKKSARFTNKEIEKKLKDILSKRLGVNPDKILEKSDLQNDLGMDSFGAIETMFAIEDKFKIRADEKELMSIKTFADMLSYVKNRQGRKK
ncbi:MAG: acyl carrier protein, partial [Candidatus Omnitrophica bacterium]|nr:acyl carrier protein [Candidatus Omnitrophota bacterium]